MKNVKKLVFVLPFVLGVSSGVTSCNKSNAKYVLRIINSDDYIYLHDATDPTSLPDMVDQFISYMEEKDPDDKYTPGSIAVVYDTSDTNETIYSELLTGKSTYDLVNVSDYMAQKIVSQNLAVKLDQSLLENYTTYASTEIKGRLDSIKANQKIYNPSLGKVENKEEYLGDYAVGYMWGTLGILFNPDYYGSIDNGEIITDMQTYNTLWNSKYKGTISVKNSMRDTYAVGLLHTFDEEFESLKLALEEGTIPVEEYQERFADLFNKCDQETVDQVAVSLDSLKDNVFGLEVDSGKQDIVTKKIGVNLAWSGDAVYSMDQAEDGLRVGENQSELCYSVPENGSNLWFDAWVMPNTARSEEQVELAHEFLNFISDPVNAAQNMNYTGYTSFIGGDSIIELVRDWYDIRTDEIYQEVETSQYVYDYYQVYSTNSTECTPIDYPDCMSDTHDTDLDRQDEALYYFVPYVDEHGELIEEPEDVQELISQNHPVYLLDENDEETETIKTYGDLLIADDPENELEVVDLTYFFDGTLEEYEAEDMIFYSDCYLPFYYENEEGEEVQNISVGRQFFCQYPSEETIVRCAVMRDYEDNNKIVMKMWENFKSDPLPTGSIILFVIIIAIILGIATTFIINIAIKKHLHKIRIKNNK